jgi:hypothetical protein
MAGAKEGHNVICSNVQTGPDTIRYPDVVVDRGPPNAAAMTASNPTLIVEVSSPGTAVFDYGDKLREYEDLRASTRLSRSSPRLRSLRFTDGKKTESGPRKSSRKLTSPFHFRRWARPSR